MNTFEEISDFNVRTGKKFDEASALLSEIANRYRALRIEKGITALNPGESRTRSGDEVLKTLYLGSIYNPDVLEESRTVEGLSKAMALVDIGDVSEPIRKWIDSHDVNGAMAKITSPNLAFQYHIPTEEISKRVSILMQLYEPISEKM